jgi:O-antigen/teichoic acid export membrane protein
MFKKIAKTFGVRFTGALLNLGVAVILSQYLGSQGKGEQGLILTTITFIILFANIISGASLVYLAPRLPIKKILTIAYLWSVLAGSLFLLLMFVLPMVDHKYMIHIAVLSVLNSFISINSSVLLGKEDIKSYNQINFLQILFTVLFLLILFQFPAWCNIQGYLLSLYWSYALCLALSVLRISKFLKSQKTISATNIESFKKMFRYGFMNQLANITQMLNFRLGFYFLEEMTGTKSVGIYSNAISIVESLWMISSSIALIQYSKIVNSDDDNASKKLTLELTKISTLVTAILILVMAAVPSVVYVFIFGAEFSIINKIIWVLAPGVWAFVFTLILGHYFSGKGRYQINSLVSFIGLIITVALSWFFIHKFNIYGAAMVYSISNLMTALLICIIFIRSTGFSMIQLFAGLNDIKVWIKKFKTIFVSNTTSDE